MGGWLSEIQKLIPFMESLDWGHLLAYFILAITYAWAFRGNITLGHKAIIVFLCVLYGITDEFHQIFVPGRMPDVKDLVNDAIGSVLAMLFISIPVVRARFESWKGAKFY
jgi:VanZ family protein